MTHHPGKPEPWDIDKSFGLIHPDWDWYWRRRPLLCSPLWDGTPGAKTQPRDLISGNLWTLTDGSAGDARWTADHTTGLSLDLPTDVNGETAQLDFTAGIGTNSDFTVCWYGRVRANTAGGWEAIWGYGGGFQPAMYATLNSASDQWGLYFGGSRTSGEQLPDGSDAWTTIVARRIGDQYVNFRDGRQVGSAHTIGTAWSGGNNMYLARGSSSEITNSSHSFVSVHDWAFTDTQIKQWCLDPFGPVRMADRIVAMPSAAAGLSIPIASYHHRHHNMAA